ncbi:dihydrodipicolinate synthase family protein [Kaistia dalseonensis]|uniref:4-hydroxy-tetrahydrodipicolinate synthase n=1 Tax=Kaistia dalseonensis TaxID=410840 RepID=A0ABU0H2T1_9HYPH|nr:dihydrodipicolinate synthase family protein [Kaistia dalseonensis]MCX5494033.1 dihydrodipicolinate synthase family protein [Kaistia dalseonensis]MDQ0436611.1 4-hydroxy-tetrahydrodipicolinate synthase [Kaistia dalseonensis]
MNNKLDERASGVFVIAVTPFTDDGRIDEASIDRVVEFYLEKGVSGITVLGMMGEAHKLTSDESRLVLDRYMKRVNGRVPVVVGVSAAGTDPLVQFADEAMGQGAAGLMLAPVPTVRTEEQIYGYFSEVLDRLGDAPVVLQDFPLVTNVNISVGTIRRIVDRYPNVVMFKHEDWPGHNKLSRLLAAEGRKISILVGNGGLYLPQELRRGAHGAMTGFAYPEMLVEVCAHFARGEAEQGEDLYDIYLPLLRHEAMPVIGIALRKEMLRRRGAIASAHVRSPGPRLNAEDHRELDSLNGRLMRRLAQSGASLARAAS